MSALTKAFVVLTTVLSVLLVALVVPFVARTQDFNNEIDNLENRLVAAEQAAATATVNTQNVRERLAAQQRQADQEAAALTAQITQLQTQLQDERAQARADRTQLADLRSSLTSFGAAAALDASLLKTLREELNTSRDEMVQVRSRNIELRDLGVELQSQLDAYDREVRRLRERMVGMQEELSRMTSLVESNPQLREQLAGGEVQPVQPPNVRGEVTGVQQAGDATLVSVDLGSSDGIQEGNRLMVARGQDFVGTLQIETVRESESAGRMVLQQGPVQEGDAIYGGQF